MIYYSHINEDCRPERAVLARSPSDSLVAIAGSGERIIGLLDHEQLKTVWAIDNNPEALWLTELKIQALKALNPEDYLYFVQGRHTNWEVHYAVIRPQLSIACQKYWDERASLIKSGILQIGAFERFLSRLRPLLCFFLGNGFLDVIRGKTSTTSPQFPQLRWKIVRWLFSRRWAYLLFGNSDPAFTGQNARLSVIPEALHQSLHDGTAPASFMMHLIFFGDFAQMPVDAIPPSMQLQVLKKIRHRLCTGEVKVHYLCGDFRDTCALPETGPHPFFSLSDLLSFEDQQYLCECIALIYRKYPEAVVAARAFVRNRFGEGQSEAFSYLWPELDIVDYTRQESTGMYQVLVFTPNRNSAPTTQIIAYTPEYDTFLAELDRKSLQGRHIHLEMVRDHFLSRAIVFEDYRASVILEDSGKPAGAGASAIVPMLLGGQPYRAGFGFDVRVLPEFRQLHLASRFAAYSLENHFKPSGCQCYFLTTKKSNREIMQHILAPLFPVFRYDFVYLTLPTGRPVKTSGKEGKPQQFFVELLSNTEELGSYYEMTDAGLGIWYLDKCYRLRIRYIHPLLNLLIRAGGWLHKQWSELIPEVGDELRMATLFNLTADKLPYVEECLSRLAGRGIPYLLVACQRNDEIYEFLHPTSINTYDYHILGSENFSGHTTLTLDVRCL